MRDADAEIRDYRTNGTLTGAGRLRVHWHIAAQSQCGSMSAAGESGLGIVVATCAGASAHRRAGGRDRGAAAAGRGAGRGANRRCSAVGLARSEDRCPSRARGVRNALAVIRDVSLRRGAQMSGFGAKWNLTLDQSITGSTAAYSFLLSSLGWTCCCCWTAG
jgi:hypothetical protein